MTDVTWKFTDDTTSWTVDGVSGDSDSTLTIGDEITLTIILEPGGVSGDHLAAYDFFKDYDAHLNEKTLDYGTDYRGQPWYRYELHPDARVSSYLFKVVPGPDVEQMGGFWGLLTGVTDQSNLVGAGEKLELTFYPLADISEFGTRTDVQNNLRAEL